MSKCRRCKYHQKEGDVELFIVHYMTTHFRGAREQFEKVYPDANWEYVDILIKEHNETGRKGIGHFKK